MMAIEVYVSTLSRSFKLNEHFLVPDGGQSEVFPVPDNGISQVNDVFSERFVAIECVR